MLADRQTDRQTRSSQYFASIIGREVIKLYIVLMCSIGLRLRNSTFWVLIGWVSFRNVESPAAETINSDVVLGENKTREGMARR